jgi:hypothetical protein
MERLMNSLASTWCVAWDEIGRGDGTEYLLSGMGIGVVAVLIIVLLLIMLRRQRKSGGIAIGGENGSLYVTQAAVREFVGVVMQDFSEAALHGMSLRRGGGGYTMRISIHVAPGAEVMSLVEDIRRRIIRQVVERMGVDAPLKVNVTVRSFTIPDAKTPAKVAGRNMMTGFPNLAGIIAPDDQDL